MAPCAFVMAPQAQLVGVRIGGMMYEEHTEYEGSSSVDLMSAAGIVRRVIGSIDDMRTEEFNILLSDLLCAAWPTPTAQSQ